MHVQPWPSVILNGGERRSNKTMVYTEHACLAHTLLWGPQSLLSKDKVIIIFKLECSVMQFTFRNGFDEEEEEEKKKGYSSKLSYTVYVLYKLYRNEDDIDLERIRVTVPLIGRQNLSHPFGILENGRPTLRKYVGE